jgi:hypothetical protein
MMKKKKELTVEEKLNDTYCKIVATVLGIPYSESSNGFAQTNYQSPGEEEVYLMGAKSGVVDRLYPEQIDHP